MRAIKPIYLALVVVLALVLGYTMGRSHTIRQAELISVDDCEYHISFGDEIHAYTFE